MYGNAFEAQDDRCHLGRQAVTFRRPSKSVSSLHEIISHWNTRCTVWFRCEPRVSSSVDLSIRALFQLRVFLSPSGNLFHAEASPHTLKSSGLEYLEKSIQRTGRFPFVCLQRSSLGERAWLRAGHSRAWIARIICWDYLEGSARRLRLVVSVSLSFFLFDLSYAFYFWNSSTGKVSKTLFSSLRLIGIV